ncbi:MAG: DUF5693 family protein [Pelosinus sp.]|nr:DUF5693 family protein [Pelosinus sp.]
MVDFKYNKILLLFIAIGLIAALTIGWQRHTVEVANQTIDMVMDYEDIVELSELEGVPRQDLLQQFKQAGLTSLAVYETTLDKLNKSGKITAVSGAQIINQYRTGMLSDANWRELVDKNAILPEDVYVTGHNQAVFDEVKSDLAHRLSPARIHEFAVGGKPVLAVKANFEKVVKWNLGLPTDEMREAAEAGFYVIARPTNYTKVNEDDVKAVFARLDAVKNVTTIMFTGDAGVLGYPDLLSLVASNMKQRHLTLGMIEHPLQLGFLKQDGLLPLASAINYQGARVYAIPKDEQPKLKVAEAIQRWELTDRERNIRMNLLRKYDKPEPGKTLVETNLAYVSGVKKVLEGRGFTLGRAGLYQPYFASPILLALVIIGAAAAGILFLTLVRPFKARYQYIMLFILSLALVIPVLKGGGTLVRQAVATVSAITFPSLAMIWQLDQWRNYSAGDHKGPVGIIGHALLGVTITLCLSLIGGFYVSGALADVRFLLEMEIFRGVKLTFVAPLIMVTLAYLTRYNLFDTVNSMDARSVGRQIKRILDLPVKVKTLLAVAIAALAAWVFVGRSGHTAGVPVPDIELKLRRFLEYTMYARPREKEFIIGHPAFFLAVMAMYKKWPQALHYALVMLATIGQGSLVETFAHMRTPVFMSFVRALDGLIAGAALGIVAVIGVQALYYLVFVLGGRPARDE